MQVTMTGVGDGSEPVVTLTFPYIDKSHVKVTVNGLPASYTWTGTNQITIAPVPSGAIWRVFRQTPTEPGIVNYTDSNPIRASDLNLDDKSHRYRDQELADYTDDTASFGLRVPERADPLPAAGDRKGTVLGFSVANGLRELLSYSALASKLLPFLSALVGTVMKGDPGSPGEGYSTRAAMAARAAPQLLDDVYLNERGREGKFVVDDASLWTNAIAADTRQGIFVQATSDPSKVYRRVYNGLINAAWFGLAADGVTDDSAAITSAIALAGALSITGYGFAGSGAGAPGVRIPAGVHWMGATTIDLVYSLILEGETAGESGGGATVLKWADVATGIRVQNNSTLGAQDVKTAVTNAGTGSIIRNLSLVGGYNGVDSESHGIHLRARAAIRDVTITNFGGDGLHIWGSAGAGLAPPYEGNANGWEATRVFIDHVRHGMWVNGADVNAGNATGVDVISARGWGIKDDGFLGNAYTACQVAVCASGAYQTTNLNAAHTFIGCYSESGQPASQFAQLTMTFGGMHAAGASGGVLMTPSTKGRLIKWGEMELKSDATTDAERGTALTLNSWGSTADINFWYQGTSYGIIRGQTGLGFQFSVGAGMANYFASAAGGYDAVISATGVDLPGAGRTYRIQGFQVVGPRQGAIADPIGGTTIDTEGRAATSAILAALRAHGLIS